MNDRAFAVCRYCRIHAQSMVYRHVRIYQRINVKSQQSTDRNTKVKTLEHLIIGGKVGIIYRVLEQF